MMNVNEIVGILDKEYPGRTIVLNTPENTEEVICEIEPASEHSDYSVAIAYIRKSKPHKHLKTIEEYQVEEGVLTLYLDGVKREFKQGQIYAVLPGTIHWAEGDWVRVKVVSKPGWTLNDHILVDEAVSAGGVIIQDGKLLVIKFPHADGITFPKGHVEEGETYKEAALREVREETGYSNLEIVRKLGVVTRPATEKDGRVVIKDIHLFLMKIVGDSKGKADEETDWLTMEEAQKRLFPQEADFLIRKRNLLISQR